MAKRNKVKLDEAKRDRDLSEYFEQFVQLMPRSTSSPGTEPTVAVPVRLATAIVDVLKRRVPKALSRPQLSGAEELVEAEIIASAVARKYELILNPGPKGKGLPKGKATDIAAEEARLRFVEVGRPLSVSTIKRLMESALANPGV